MEVILQEKIRHLGNIGDRVNVAGGFGRNFLIPQGKAVPATAKNIEIFQARRAELEKLEAEHLQEAQKRAGTLSALVVTIRSKAGDEGKLFGSIGTRDIADAINAAGVHVEKSEIRLPNGVIRLAGDYDITLQLHTDVAVDVKVKIIPEA